MKNPEDPQLPIFDDFDRTATFEDMAYVLIQAPPAILARYDTTLRARLLRRGFPAALSYLESVGVAMNGVRYANGMVTHDANRILFVAALRLKEAAAELDGVRT